MAGRKYPLLVNSTTHSYRCVYIYCAIYVIILIIIGSYAFLSKHAKIVEENDKI